MEMNRLIHLPLCITSTAHNTLFKFGLMSPSLLLLSGLLQVSLDSNNIGNIAESKPEQALDDERAQRQKRFNNIKKNEDVLSL